MHTCAIGHSLVGRFSCTLSFALQLYEYNVPSSSHADDADDYYYYYYYCRRQLQRRRRRFISVNYAGASRPYVDQMHNALDCTQLRDRMRNIRESVCAYSRKTEHRSQYIIRCCPRACDCCCVLASSDRTNGLDWTGRLIGSNELSPIGCRPGHTLSPIVAANLCALANHIDSVAGNIVLYVYILYNQSTWLRAPVG